MRKINAYCKICGKGYHMCYSCKDYARLHPWQSDTDSAEHFKVFQILSGYHSGIYSIKDAKERLLNVDISDLENYKDDKKQVIKTILDFEEDSSNNKSAVKTTQSRTTTRKRKVKSVNNSEE